MQLFLPAEFSLMNTANVLNRESAWRQLEDPEWVKTQQSLGWMGSPGMHCYVNSYFPGNQPWFEYARNSVLEPLQKFCVRHMGRGVHLLSLGCGNGEVDAECLRQGWQIDSYHIAEYDDNLLMAAAKRLCADALTKSVVSHRFDYDSLNEFECGMFDAIFFCHSLHHCSDIEGLHGFIRRSLHPHGIVFGADYFGGARLQPDFAVLPLLQSIYFILPDAFKVNLQNGELEDRYVPQSFESVMVHDPSEAPRSGDLRSLFLGQLKELNVVPMGGTLLRPLLANRAGHFASSEQTVQSVLKLLMKLESELILCGKILSDDLFFFGKP